jgi:hypothetical protein
MDNAMQILKNGEHALPHTAFNLAGAGPEQEQAPAIQTSRKSVAHNKRFLFGTNPNSIENKGSLEE